MISIMTNRGWEQGAALLRHWTDHPSNDKPDLGVPDFSTVGVAWTLGFSRAAEIYRQSIANKIWTTTHARQLLRSVIERRVRDADIKSSLLRVDMLRYADPDTINITNRINIYDDRVAFAPMTDSSTVDGLTAALGRFGYYFNVSGGCEPKGEGFEVHISRVGIYIRDSYDFNDDYDWWNPATWGSQHLGFWDSQRSYVSGAMPMHCWTNSHVGSLSQMFGSPTSFPYDPKIAIGVPECGVATRITNNDFQNYRKHTLMGSDFWVYSDIMYVDTDDVILV